MNETTITFISGQTKFMHYDQMIEITDDIPDEWSTANIKLPSKNSYKFKSEFTKFGSEGSGMLLQDESLSDFSSSESSDDVDLTLVNDRSLVPPNELINDSSNKFNQKSKGLIADPNREDITAKLCVIEENDIKKVDFYFDCEFRSSEFLDLKKNENGKLYSKHIDNKELKSIKRLNTLQTHIKKSIGGSLFCDYCSEKIQFKKDV